MRAVGFRRPGPPEVLEVLEVPRPDPGPDEVRVRVAAAAVHPADLAIRSGSYPVEVASPHVPGMAAAGTIDAVGDGSAWAVGDRVLTMALPSGPHGGAYVDHLVAPDDSLARVPGDVDLAVAATLPMNGHTALQALRLLALTPGDTLAVTGAAGALGAIVIPLAVADGLRVVADAAPDDADLVRSRGAEVVVPRGDDVATHIREATDGVGSDGLVDAAVLDDAIVPAVRDGGGIASLRGWTGPAGRGIRVHPVYVTEEHGNGAELDRLVQLVASGHLVPPEVARFGPDQAALAHHLAAGAGVRNGVVIDLS